MHPNLRQLSLLINKISEIEALLSKQGIEFISLPPDLDMDGESDDSNEPDAESEDDADAAILDEELEDEFLIYLSFDREAIRGWTRIILSVSIAREKALDAKNPVATILASLELKTKLSEADQEISVISLVFEIDDLGQVKTRLDKNEMDLDQQQDEHKELLNVFESIFGEDDLDPKKTADLIAKIVEYFKLQPETGKIAQA